MITAVINDPNPISCPRNRGCGILQGRTYADQPVGFGDDFLGHVQRQLSISWIKVYIATPQTANKRYAVLLFEEQSYKSRRRGGMGMNYIGGKLPDYCICGIPQTEILSITGQGVKPFPRQAQILRVTYRYPVNYLALGYARI